MRILVVTDTWDNVNGVVTTLRATKQELEKRGHEVFILEPSLFKTVAMWGYPEIRIAYNLWKVGEYIEDFKPDAIHIATEGTLGLAVRWYCKVRARQIPHNTSYHTKFPEYFKIHTGLPLCVGYGFLKMFHKFSHRVLVTTKSIEKELASQGFENLVVWGRGVDFNVFKPDYRKNNIAAKPILLCVSRASKEKGLDDFCSINTAGTKILVGDGPYLAELKRKYPDVIFTGYKHGKQLAEYYANADVFVFPSKSDTFGVVMLEAMACGTPVAAYPVTGPQDVIEPGKTGYLNDNLTMAIEQCLSLDRHTVHTASTKFSWKACTDIFEQNLVSTVTAVLPK